MESKKYTQLNDQLQTMTASPTAV